MIMCKINGKLYLMDCKETETELYSVETTKTYFFSPTFKVSNIKKFLEKRDIA